MQAKSETITVILADFDGCVSPTSNVDQPTHHSLFSKFKRMRESSSSTYLSSFSSRQSILVENNNIESASSGVAVASCKYFSAVARDILGMPYDPTTMADVIGNRPYGSSQALLISDRYIQDVTFAPNAPFDETKTSLLYFKSHDAVNRSVSCDFVKINNIETEWRSIYALSFKGPESYRQERLLLQLELDLKDVNFRSNAAYVYFQQISKVFYVNRIKGETKCIDLSSTVHIDKFIHSQYDERPHDDYDFEIPLCAGETGETGETKATPAEESIATRRLCGTTLNNQQLRDLTRAISCDANVKTIYVEHQASDCAIKLAVYDDREDITNALLKMDGDKIPANVVINVYQYVNTDFKNGGVQCGKLIGKLSGTGPIDLHPGETISHLTCIETKNPEIDYQRLYDELGIKNLDFSKHFMSGQVLRRGQKEIFSQRKVRATQVGSTYQPVPDEHLAMGTAMKKHFTLGELKLDVIDHYHTNKLLSSIRHDSREIIQLTNLYHRLYQVGRRKSTRAAGANESDSWDDKNCYKEVLHELLPDSTGDIPSLEQVLLRRYDQRRYSENTAKALGSFIQSVRNAGDDTQVRESKRHK